VVGAAKRISTILAEVAESVVPPLPHRATKSAPTNIIVFFTARSGSSWLGDLLTRAKIFGNVHEWLNPDFVFETAKKVSASNERDYLDRIRHEFGSANNIFSMKVTYSQLSLLSDMDFFDYFLECGKTYFFYLSRRDVVAQATSLFLSNKTGKFHSVQDDRESDAFQYENVEIIDSMRHLIQEEVLLESRMIRHRIQPYRLYYEELVDAPHNVLEVFYRVIHKKKGPASNPRSPYQKLSADRAVDIRANFEHSCRDQIAALLSLRPRSNVCATSWPGDRCGVVSILTHVPYFQFVSFFGAGILLMTNANPTLFSYSLDHQNGRSEQLIAESLQFSLIGDELYSMKLPNRFWKTAPGGVLAMEYQGHQCRMVVPEGTTFAGAIDWVKDGGVSGWVTPVGPYSSPPPCGIRFDEGMVSELVPDVRLPWAVSVSVRDGLDGFRIEYNENCPPKKIDIVDQRNAVICSWGAGNSC
jgi:LPS sulfotransferase NodH